jgi:signal transduction histidine kinase
MMDSQPHPARFSARSFLPLGFCGVFLLMAGALVESYRMRVTIRTPLVSMAAYDQADALVEHVRHGFNQSQIVARDFLLKSGASEVFRSKLHGCETEVMDAIGQIDRLGVEGKLIPTVRAGFSAHFQSLGEVAEWPERERRQRGQSFIGEDLPRLRAPLNRVVREMADGNQSGRRRATAEGVAASEAATRRILFLLGADLLLALGVAGLNLAYARELGRESLSKVAAIAHTKTEMQQLSGRLLTIQEEERHRLSRDLHDGIGQLLTALRLEISHLGLEREELSAADRERLQRARKLAEEAVRSTRDIALLLRPSHLDDLGLEPALQWLVEDFSRRTGIACNFSATGLDENLPDAWKTCVYRVVQEAIHNCEKHAAPAQVQIRVSQEPELLALEVQDNGVGFELDAKGAPLRAVGLGILGMRERAAMLGGALQIVSAPGHGTTVRLALPTSPMRLAPSEGKGAAAPRQVEA